MKNSVIIILFLFALALMSFTSEFEKQDKFKIKPSLLDTVKIAVYWEKESRRAIFPNIVVDTIDFNIVIYKEVAHASYYHDKFTGRKTANGAVFNNNELTCAHKTLPFGTKLKVTSIKTGKSVRVTVTDRGPFVKGRHIDLSKKAFMKIAPNRYGGYIRVNIEIIKE